MTAPTTSTESIIDSNDFHEWLATTLAKFPAPGPTVAMRLIDILEPEIPHSQVNVSDAA